MQRRRWLIWMVCLIPMAGIGFALAAPKIDEYAPFEQAGTPFDPDSPQAYPNQNVGFVPTPYAPFSMRHRGWRLNLPETEARRLMTRFACPKRDWQGAPPNHGTSWEEIPETGMMKTTYTESQSFDNRDTGDRLHFQIDKQESPSKKLLQVAVTVEQNPSSLRPLKRLKRWCHLHLSP